MYWRRKLSLGGMVISIQLKVLKFGKQPKQIPGDQSKVSSGLKIYVQTPDHQTQNRNDCTNKPHLLDKSSKKHNCLFDKSSFCSTPKNNSLKRHASPMTQATQWTWFDRDNCPSPCLYLRHFSSSWHKRIISPLFTIADGQKEPNSSLIQLDKFITTTHWHIHCFPTNSFRQSSPRNCLNCQLKHAHNSGDARFQSALHDRTHTHTHKLHTTTNKTEHQNYPRLKSNRKSKKKHEHLHAWKNKTMLSISSARSWTRQMISYTNAPILFRPKR